MRTVLTLGRFSFAVAAAATAGTADSAELTLPAEAASTMIREEPPLAPGPRSRKERRAAKKFNRLLERRLSKDKTPVRVEVQPDGGLHVQVNTREK